MDAINNSNCNPDSSIEEFQHDDYVHTLHSKAYSINSHAKSALNMIKHSSAKVEDRAKHAEMLSQILDLSEKLIQASIKL